MSDHVSSIARNYQNIVHVDSVTPLFPFDNSDQFDLSIPIIEPLHTDLQSQAALLNFNFCCVLEFVILGQEATPRTMKRKRTQSAVKFCRSIVLSEEPPAPSLIFLVLAGVKSSMAAESHKRPVGNNAIH
ncbi:NAC domain-containing protein 7 [Hordeum vulgare]|nr:NAC domain-containing protein 7 [Hordeum vulgare]